MYELREARGTPDGTMRSIITTNEEGCEKVIPFDLRNRDFYEFICDFEDDNSILSNYDELEEDTVEFLEGFITAKNG